MKLRSPLFAAVCALCLAPAAFAQTHSASPVRPPPPPATAVMPVQTQQVRIPNPSEVSGQPQQQVRIANPGVADDRWDLRQLEALVDRFDRVRRHDRVQIAAIDGDLRRYLDAELREGRREVRQARAETDASLRDVRYDPHSRAERRDARDDLRDEKRESAQLMRTRAIASDYERLVGRYDRRSLERRRALMGELLQLSRAELQNSRDERREDRNRR